MWFQELPCRLDKSIENLKRMHSLLTGEDGVMTLESLIAGCELVGIDHAKDQSSWFKGNRLQVELDRSGGGTGGAADLVTMALQKPADITRDLVTPSIHQLDRYNCCMIVVPPTASD